MIFPPDPTFNLAAYLARIGYAGPRDATLETLKALHLLHPQAIPFENLDPFLGRPVPLDLASLQRKLIDSRRGGYCFEQNRIFAAALAALGFQVTCLAARVIWNQPEDALPPRSHMLLRLDIDGASFVADVGFGGQTPTGPLRLAFDVEQPTPHEPFRLIRAGHDIKLQSLIEGEWKSLYRFDLQPQAENDYVAANYYMATHPDSHFRNMLVAARVTPDARHGLRNDRLTVRCRGGATEYRVLAGPEEIADTLENGFDIAVPDRAALVLAARRFFAPASV